MKRVRNFAGENVYYHVFNRGVERRNIFLEKQDYHRFIFLMLLFQGDVFFDNAHRLARVFEEHQMLNKEVREEIIKARTIKLIGFVLMPNHFHFILRGIQDDSISKFIQRLCNSYAKYFNIKYKRSGHLFGSRFHKKLIDTNEYLLHLSAYIHRNPRELKGWKGKEQRYPWSSYQDYIKYNRWRKFLDSSLVLEQFSDLEEYFDFVKTNPSKELEDEMRNI